MLAILQLILLIVWIAQANCLREIGESSTELMEKLTDYFVSERGSVSWQWDYIRRTGEIKTSYFIL